MTEPVQRACFFCGPTNKPLTKEHVWPGWVSRLLLGWHGSDHFVHRRAVGDTMVHKWKSHDFDVTTKRVCSDCNGGWLSEFENQIKAIASQLIVGNTPVAVALAPGSRALLAAWAYKMAMLLEVSNPKRSAEFFTPADRLRFRQTTSAHWFVRVFLSRYEFEGRPAHAMTPRHTFTESTGAQRSFFLKISTVTAGYLAMQVMCVRSVTSNELVPADEIRFELSDSARHAVFPIWPPVPGYLRWPPDRTMRHQDVEDWTSMWIKAANEMPAGPTSRDFLTDGCPDYGSFRVRNAASPVPSTRRSRF